MSEALPMDNDAFVGFYQRSAPALRAYLARVSRNPVVADDLTQESYLRFLCASRPEEGEVNHRRYLFGIASNLLRDYWRSQPPECGRGRGSYCGWPMQRSTLIVRSARLRASARPVFVCFFFEHGGKWRACCERKLPRAGGKYDVPRLCQGS